MNLLWRDVRLEPAHGAKFGYLTIVEGKSKYAKRQLSLTSRVRAMLTTRKQKSRSGWVFPGASAEKPILVTSLDHKNAEVRKLLKLSGEFVIHSLRHTMLTRLGEAGADAFTIMRIAGHSSVTVSQRYMHPTPEALERAFERLEALNGQAVAGLLETPKRLRPATVSATLAEDVVVSY